ncbi:hypothetical protein OC842_002916 [Tilletia horrida]|uniref:Uncharacterized protein n=1 Tax=Tilletia horrida TaxID=155126 RepID=A0AAN6GF65_9BASI|nr:hypothetical protein OC842_002916 [Tilletia horrida]
MSFAPTLIAPAPCRPIPLVRNRHHQHHHSRYHRLSGGSSIGSTAGMAAITTPPLAALPSAAVRSMSPHFHPYAAAVSSSASAGLAAAASAASAFVFPHRPAAAAPSAADSGRRSASLGKERREQPTSPPPAGSSSLLSTLAENPADASSTTDSLKAEPHIDHDLTPTRKIMQSFSASINLNDLQAQRGRPAESTPSTSTDSAVTEKRRDSSPFLEVPASAASLQAITNHGSPTLFSTAASSPAMSDADAYSGTTTPALSSPSVQQTPGGLAMSPDPTIMPGNPAAPLHPTLIPPSPIPRRLTRNPFARSLSQGYGLGISNGSAGSGASSAATRSESNLGSFVESEGALAYDEPAPRFSLDTIGIGLMDIDFDLDAISADDGGRELLRVERERRKRSFEMHC